MCLLQTEMYNSVIVKVNIYILLVKKKKNAHYYFNRKRSKLNARGLYAYTVYIIIIMYTMYTYSQRSYCNIIKYARKMLFSA